MYADTRDMSREIIDWWFWDVPLISPKVIQELNNHILKHYEHEEDKENGAINEDTGEYLKNITPKVIKLKKMPEIYHDMISMAFSVCHHEFGFTTFPPNIWDSALYSVYSGDVKGKYGKHIDHSRTLKFDIKMTFIMNLSMGEYEGGDLIVNDKLINFKTPGQAILFRSNLIHEVTPVTKGDRISLSYFIHGPRHP